MEDIKDRGWINLLIDLFLILNVGFIENVVIYDFDMFVLYVILILKWYDFIMVILFNFCYVVLIN